MAKQAQGLIGRQLGLGQKSTGEREAVLEAARHALAQQLGQVPELAPTAQKEWIKLETTLQEPLSLPGLEQEIGDVAPGSQIGGVAAAEQLASYAGVNHPALTRITILQLPGQR
ncbi:MAG: hypothetical protein QUV06_00015 [Cyanobium sp. CZS 48M]|nr:hypothetical protein [Cyanobium sp. CZS48M]